MRFKMSQEFPTVCLDLSSSVTVDISDYPTDEDVNNLRFHA